MALELGDYIRLSDQYSPIMKVILIHQGLVYAGGSSIDRPICVFPIREVYEPVNPIPDLKFASRHSMVASFGWLQVDGVNDSRVSVIGNGMKLLEEMALIPVDQQAYQLTEYYWSEGKEVFTGVNLHFCSLRCANEMRENRSGKLDEYKTYGIWGGSRWRFSVEDKQFFYLESECGMCSTPIRRA